MLDLQLSFAISCYRCSKAYFIFNVLALPTKFQLERPKLAFERSEKGFRGVLKPCESNELIMSSLNGVSG